MMKVVIPTFRRTRDQRTLQALGPSLWKHVTLVARPEEVSELQGLYPDVTVVGLPGHVRTLPATRQWVLEAWGSERFMMADDDVREFRRRDLLPGTSTVCSETLTGEALTGLFACLEEELSAGAGLAGPLPSWLPPDPEHYWPRKTCGSVLQFVALDGPKLLKAGVRYDRVEMAEDVDVLLQVLAAGLDAVHRVDWGFVVPPMGSLAGGLDISKQERLALEERAMAKLSLLWPGYVTPSKRSPGKWNVYRARLYKDAKAGRAKFRTLTAIEGWELPQPVERLPLTEKRLDALGREGVKLRKELEGRLARAPGDDVPCLRPGPTPGRQAYEFLLSPPTEGPEELVAWLNTMGRDGWRPEPIDLGLEDGRLIVSRPLR